jgi:hypothetical protein
MKDLLRTLLDDIHAEGYTTAEVIKYGIVAPIALVLVCGILETILS